VGSKGLSQRKQQLEKAFNQATQLEHIVYSAYGVTNCCRSSAARHLHSKHHFRLPVAL
jgi:hypothetical protein